MILLPGNSVDGGPKDGYSHSECILQSPTRPKKARVSFLLAVEDTVILLTTFLSMALVEGAFSGS